jgi:prepilin-type N-terminal cleavage/methylation domain-containing protein
MTGSVQIARKNERAFTLMEVMLALMVSAILLAAVGGVFYTAIRLKDRTVAMLDEAIPLHQAVNFLRRDLQGVLPPAGLYAMTGDFRNEQISGGIGQNFRLQFFTSSGITTDNSPWSEVQQISYELRDPISRTNGTGRELIRTVVRNLLATGTQEQNEQFLLGNVHSLEFSCFDGYNWRDSWDTGLGDTNLPSAVRVRLQFSSENGVDTRTQGPFELIVPLLCQSRTNQIQTASTGGTQ